MAQMAPGSRAGRPTRVAAAVAGLWAGWLVRGAAPEPNGGTVSSPRIEGLPAVGEDRMFSLWGAAAVAALLAGIQALVHALDLWLGQAGLIAGTLVAALADLHAALAAVFSSSGSSLGPHAAIPVMVALAVHAGSKSVTAGLVGGWPYLRWLAPGLWVHTALGVALIGWLMV